MDGQSIKIDVGSGELVDKLTILQIKSERITNGAKLVNVRHELGVLMRVFDTRVSKDDTISQFMGELKSINEELWEIEDDIRVCEGEKNFDTRFIELARAVYITNDKRAAVKKQINLHTGADIVEEKSYTEFD